MNYETKSNLRVLCWKLERLLKEAGDSFSVDERSAFHSALALVERIAAREGIDLHPTP